MLRFTFGFRILSPSMTSIYKSKLSDPCEYVVATYINRMDLYCQWHSVSKHNSTHTEKVCHIITDVGSLRKTLVLQASLSHHLIHFSFPNEKFTSLPYGRYLWGAGFTMVNTSLWWASATLPQLLPFIWTNISANNTLHGFWFRAQKDFSNSQEEFYVDICRLSHIRFSWINIICGILIMPLNSLWFPITTESRCFDVPAHKNVCTSVLGSGWYTSVRCHSTRGWITFSDWGDHLFCFNRNIRELSLMWPEFSPSCSHLGRRVVY